jgi:hypothetical protein
MFISIDLKFGPSQWATPNVGQLDRFSSRVDYARGKQAASKPTESRLTSRDHMGDIWFDGLGSTSGSAHWLGIAVGPRNRARGLRYGCVLI